MILLNCVINTDIKCLQWQTIVSPLSSAWASVKPESEYWEDQIHENQELWDIRQKFFWHRAANCNLTYLSIFSFGSGCVGLEIVFITFYSFSVGLDIRKSSQSLCFSIPLIQQMLVTVSAKLLSLRGVSYAKGVKKYFFCNSIGNSDKRINELRFKVVKYGCICFMGFVDHIAKIGSYSTRLCVVYISYNSLILLPLVPDLHECWWSWEW